MRAGHHGPAAGGHAALPELSSRPHDGPGVGEVGALLTVLASHIGYLCLALLGMFDTCSV